MESLKQLQNFINSTENNKSQLTNIQNVIKNIIQQNFQINLSLNLKFICLICNNFIHKHTQNYTEHDLCQQNFHNSCIQQQLKQNYENLLPEDLLKYKCVKCEKTFILQQLENAFQKKELNQVRNKYNQKIAQQIDDEIKKENEKIAENYKFECQICMDEGLNINQECVMIGDCEHRVCKVCFIDQIKDEYTNGFIQCSECALLPEEERRFNGRLDQTDRSINIHPNIIKQQLGEENKEIFEKFLYFQGTKGITVNDNEIFRQCPGKLRVLKNNQKQKNADKNNNDIEQKDEQEQQKNDQEGGQDNKKEGYNKIIDQEILIKFFEQDINPGFEMEDCPASYIIDQDQDIEKLKCQVCEYEYCPKCQKQVHKDMSCKEYQDKITKEKGGEQYIEQLLKDYPKKYQKCPACKTLCEKISGCNRVPCGNISNPKKGYVGCDVHFCWVCNEFYDKDYNKVYNHLSKEHGGYHG